MSHLISRILLTIFLIPIASLIYLVAVLRIERSYSYAWGMSYDRDTVAFVGAGTLTWLFLAASWFLLWRKSVVWTSGRIAYTCAMTVVAAIAAAIIGAACTGINSDFATFIGTASAPLLWLTGTVFVWRESPAERAARVTRSGRDSVVCPTCGYNLTGLSESRCPECGTKFTLDQLLADQPARAQVDLES